MAMKVRSPRVKKKVDDVDPVEETTEDTTVLADDFVDIVEETKEDIPETVEEATASTEEPVEEPVVLTPLKVKFVPSAYVSLSGPSTLRLQGRLYRSGVVFVVSGEEKILYYRNNGNFKVVDKK